MPDSYSQQVDELLIKIDGQTDAKTRRKMLKLITAHEKSVLDEYPPATQANRRPGNNGRSWYVRGFGTRTITGRSYPTSEKFSKRWRERFVGSSRRDLDNNASYGGYLMGDAQVGWAGARGWKEMRDVLRQESRELREIAQDVIRQNNRN